MTAQQRNGSDCWPATLAALLHITKDEPHEASIEGETLRLSHLRISCEHMQGTTSQPTTAPNSTHVVGSRSEDPIIDNLGACITKSSAIQLLRKLRSCALDQGFKMESRVPIRHLECSCKWKCHTQTCHMLEARSSCGSSTLAAMFDILRK